METGAIDRSAATNTRFAWVDVLKFFGILFIYIGHNLQSAGKLYPFVFTFHVPLFFLMSGFFAFKKKPESFSVFLRKKFLTIMVPYYFFNLVNIIYKMLRYNAASHELIDMLRQTLFCTRNDTVTSALWFLPCLFLMQILFEIIVRIVKKDVGIWIVAIVLFYVAVFTPIGSIKIFNINQLLFYFPYYVIGAFSFASLRKLQFETLSLTGKFILALVTLFCLLFSFSIYLGKSQVISAWLLLPRLPLAVNKLVYPVYSVAIACSSIFICILASKLLERVGFLSKLGQDTLIFCGTETLLKEAVVFIFGSFGLSYRVMNPYVLVIYTFLLLALSHHTIVRFFQKYFPFCVGRIKA